MQKCSITSREVTNNCNSVTSSIAGKIQTDIIVFTSSISGTSAKLSTNDSVCNSVDSKPCLLENVTCSNSTSNPLVPAV